MYILVYKYKCDMCTAHCHHTHHTPLVCPPSGRDTIRQWHSCDMASSQQPVAAMAFERFGSPSSESLRAAQVQTPPASWISRPLWRWCWLLDIALPPLRLATACDYLYHPCAQKKGDKKKSQRLFPCLFGERLDIEVVVLVIKYWVCIR
jgi:hypothetical protein